ncbi:hypothetical protein M422DRAFT_256815 [Sphaerobolus stellatus SS14]|uniref:Uncharacterized protein n=1 Tax=Sphaerobolus stellatus (strain SS14) TaxID=990650 RepID=A0A0C9UAU1_SPHS4|nr:hypothetical protein M422DRAFT_256815 [Sphaerobolus stellatus SS14]
MSYHYAITDEQLAPFLEAAKLMMIPMNKVPPLVVKEVPAPSASQNETILVMHQALIAEAIKTNAKNAKEYKERKELWYCETAIAAYLDTKRKVEKAAAKKDEEVAKAAAKAAEEEKNEHVRDVNSEGEVKVDQDETPKSKKKMKSCLIVDLESEEETEEVKAKRRKGKGKGKGKAVNTEYKQNTVPIDYLGCPGVPVRKICEGCKVPRNAWYQRPCVGNVIMDADDQIFSDKAEFIMPEAADDKELQAKLRKLCHEQDVFKNQKDKERVERNKILGNKTKAGTKKKVQVNMKASGSTPKGSKRKVVSEEDDIEVTSRPKRARTVVNSDGSNERIPSVTESLHGINQALIETVNLLGDTQAANERQAKYLRRIEICMANLQSAMQTHIGQVHYCLGELERRAGISPMEDEEFADPEDMEELVKEVREEVKEVHKEVEEVREEDKGG